MLKPAMAKKLRERREAREDAIQAFEDAVVEAWTTGASLNEIAHEVDWSHQSVSNLLARLGVRKKWRGLADANRELDRREALERRDRGE